MFPFCSNSQTRNSPLIMLQPRPFPVSSIPGESSLNGWRLAPRYSATSRLRPRPAPNREDPVPERRDLALDAALKRPEGQVAFFVSVGLPLPDVIARGAFEAEVRDR